MVGASSESQRHSRSGRSRIQCAGQHARIACSYRDLAKTWHQEDALESLACSLGTNSGGRCLGCCVRAESEAGLRGIHLVENFQKWREVPRLFEALFAKATR